MQNTTGKRPEAGRLQRTQNQLPQNMTHGVAHSVANNPSQNHTSGYNTAQEFASTSGMWTAAVGRLTPVPLAQKDSSIAVKDSLATQAESISSLKANSIKLDTDT